MPTNAFGVRAELRAMPIPTAIVYVGFTVLALVAKTLGYVFGLLAEITDRAADAGHAARVATIEHHHAQQVADLTPPTPFTTGSRVHTAGGTR